jgi:hypothetical protein
MAVLIEAISVVIRVDRLLELFGWEEFKKSVPNDTLCSDNELARVGFMAPPDVKGFVGWLELKGLRYLEGNTARDLVVVDQNRGPMMPCTWIEFGHIPMDKDERKRVAACRLVGSRENRLFTPEGWEYDNSLSASYGFVPNEHAHRSLKFLRREGGLDV